MPEASSPSTANPPTAGSTQQSPVQIGTMVIQSMSELICFQEVINSVYNDEGDGGNERGGGRANKPGISKSTRWAMRRFYPNSVFCDNCKDLGHTTEECSGKAAPTDRIESVARSQVQSTPEQTGPQEKWSLKKSTLEICDNLKQVTLLLEDVSQNAVSVDIQIAQLQKQITKLAQTQTEILLLLQEQQPIGAQLREEEDWEIAEVEAELID